MKLKDFLAEDLGRGDVTSSIVVPKGKKAEAAIISKEHGVIAGIEEAARLCSSAKIKIRPKVKDGQTIAKGGEIARLEGDARKILGMERTLLNILSHMSGIATRTSKLSKIAKGKNKNILIAATRKTLPGIRSLQKKAVMMGGGLPHRYDLSSMILIKDNHIKLAGGMRNIKKTFRGKKKNKLVEVEVTNERETMEASEFADIIMFDNMNPKKITKAIRKLESIGKRGNIIFEASGGINENNIASYAASGVDFLSLGSLTNSAKALDISLEII